MSWNFKCYCWPCKNIECFSFTMMVEFKLSVDREFAIFVSVRRVFKAKTLLKALVMRRFYVERPCKVGQAFFRYRKRASVKVETLAQMVERNAQPLQALALNMQSISVSVHGKSTAGILDVRCARALKFQTTRALEEALSTSTSFEVKYSILQRRQCEAALVQWRGILCKCWY